MSAKVSFGERGIERIGHRGAPRERLENTTAAFDRAIELGADAVELDVHVSEDGMPVVHHDPALGRSVMPAAMRGREIQELTATELATIDLGGGSPLPTLVEVLERIGRRARVYVEIKQGAEQAVVDVIRRTEAECAIHSFDHAAIERVAVAAPEIPRGILFDAYPDDVVAAMRRARARDVWPAWRLVDATLIDLVHASGGRVIPWTVDSRAAAERMAKLGVDAICTNDLRKLGRGLRGARPTTGEA